MFNEEMYEKSILELFQNLLVGIHGRNCIRVHTGRPDIRNHLLQLQLDLLCACAYPLHCAATGGAHSRNMLGKTAIVAH